MPRNRPVPQYSAEDLGIAIYADGELTDPDGDVTLGIWREDDDVNVVPAGTLATRDDTGLYSYTLTSDITQTQGDYRIEWDYTLDGFDRTYTDHFAVMGRMPYWEMLGPEEREMVLNIYHKISDTFDSTEGGPYLWELYQTQFNAFETIARLMITDAIAYINYTFQPAFIPPFVVGGQEGRAFPPQWYGLLERAGYVEMLKHLSRSYIEQPDVVGVSTGRLDRRRYREEWRTEWQDEKEILDSMLKMFKRKFLVGGTRRAMAVAGGNLPRLLVNPARPSWRYAVARY